MPDEGDVFRPGEEPVVAPGVRAIVFDMPNGIYIPFIFSEEQGKGNVRRYLESLPKDRRIVFSTVISFRFERILQRAGFTKATEVDELSGERVDIYERLPS